MMTTRVLSKGMARLSALGGALFMPFAHAHEGHAPIVNAALHFWLGHAVPVLMVLGLVLLTVGLVTRYQRLK